MARTRLRLAAALTVVVLALTGFETGKGGHGSSGGGSGKSDSDGSGGGCSSSDKKNDDYDGHVDGSGSGSVSGSGDDSGSGSDPYTPDPAPTVTATATTSSRVEAVVVDCVDPAQRKRKGKPAREADTTATVELTPSHWSVRGTFQVFVEFKDAKGVVVDRSTAEVTVAEGTPETVDVYMRAPGAVDRVKNCVVTEVRERQ
ncbi:hypothetical protein [Streptomyces sp. NPDC003327]